MNALPPGRRVITHDGYRAEQTPIAVVFDEQRFDVTVIEDAWIATGVDPADAVRRGYLVKCKGGSRFRIEHTEQEGWNIERIPGPHLVL